MVIGEWDMCKQNSLKLKFSEEPSEFSIFAYRIWINKFTNSTF